MILQQIWEVPKERWRQQSRCRKKAALRGLQLCLMSLLAAGHLRLMSFPHLQCLMSLPTAADWSLMSIGAKPLLWQRSFLAAVCSCLKLEFFKSQQYFKEQEGGWSYFYHNSRTDMHETSGLGNQKIWKLSLDIASHRELYWYQLYFIDTSQDVKSQYVYTTFTIKWKGPVPFTQQVKVRRGKLVLALPSIRFLWNFYQIISGTKYE